MRHPRARTLVAAACLAVLPLMLSGCPIFYGWMADDEWAKTVRTERSRTYRSTEVRHIGVVSPFPKKWESTWLYDGSEAERFAHILWQRFPERHVYRIDLPTGTTPEAVEKALKTGSRAEVMRVLEVDYPLDVLVLGEVVESDFDNAFLQGYFTTRKGEATAYDLEGHRLWHAEAAARGSVAHVAWLLTDKLAESFPK